MLIPMQTRLNYCDYIHLLYNPEGYEEDDLYRDITLQVTSDCNLRCSYCYEHHKSNNKMSQETAYKIADYLIDSWEKNEPGSFINKHTRFLSIMFIGGEPLLEADLIDKFCEYFLCQCALRKCPLGEGTRFYFSTNGINFFDDRVQKFIKKYENFLSISVSLDGIKELHDRYRVDESGAGSFDRAYKAFMSLPHRMTKMTFVPESFKYVADSIIFILESGAEAVLANCAYEPYYSPRDGAVLYNQLKKVSDYLIKNRETRHISILQDAIGLPADVKAGNYCGGTGKMLTFTPDGKAYPCIRYAPISIGEEKSKALCIGDFYGIYNTPHTKKIRDYLDEVTMVSQSTEECISCPIGLGCGWCSALHYEVYGDVNKRITNICWAHRARVLASCYYFNKAYLEENPLVSEPRPILIQEKVALQIISKEEWNELKDTEHQALLKYEKLNS